MTEDMRVGMYYNNSDVRLETMPVPKIGDRELLLQVKASGICGSDVLEWYRIKSAPLVLGHEVAGVVSQIGKEVTKYKPGDRVFVTHHVPCNTCDYCLDGHETACDTLYNTKFDPGGFAQFLRVPEINVDRGMLNLPDNVSFHEGSFIEPLGTVVRGSRKAQIGTGDNVLILGAGTAGLLYVKMARALGASTVGVTDLNPYRMNKAIEFGADYALNAKEDVPAEVQNAIGGLANKVIICAGALPAIEQGLASVDRGGTVMFFAVPKPGENVSIDLTPYWRNDVTFMTSYASAPRDSAQALELISTGVIDVQDMITDVLPLEEIAEGFKMTADGGESIKVIIEPNEK